MSKKKGMSKKELRAPDEFQTIVLELTEKYGQYWKLALGILILIIVIPLAVTGYNYYEKNKENKAAIGYTQLTNSIKSLPPAKKLSKIDKFLNNYSGTKASFFAMLLKGKILFDIKKFNDAITVYNAVISDSPKEEFKSLAKLNIALCNEKTGKVETAVNQLKNLTNNATVGADATFYLAQLFEKEHKIIEAKNLYQEITDKYKNYPYYKICEIKASSL